MEKLLRVLVPVIAFSLSVIGVLIINYSEQMYAREYKRAEVNMK